MPELPEVERARALIEERALRRRIAHVDDHDSYVCRPHPPGEIADALMQSALTAAHRRGKSMWVETDSGRVLGLHLGMAGTIVIDGYAAGDPRTGAQKPRWDRFVVQFEDGGRLTLRDRRRLARVVLDPNIARLGPDAADVDRDTFRQRIGRGAAAVKARMMDQSAIAGVGNLLADETLWRAGVDPLRPAASLSTQELDRLRRELRAATRSAIAKGGVHTGRLISERRPGGCCPRCGAQLERGRVGGRTTWWCPREQH